MVVRVAARCSAHAPLPLPRPRLQLQEFSKTSRSRARPTATRPSEQCERYASSSTRSSAPSSSPSASQWVSQSWTRCCRRMSMSTSASMAAAEAPLRPSMVASVASTAAAGTAATAATAALLLAPLVAELDRMAPRVDIHGSQVCVIETPAEFYETLTKMIRGAKRRIFLSTLYIGTSERELVATLQSALRANPDLTLHILTDALRGTRESPRPSSASLLAPLVAEFGPERVDIRMYHTPNLTGLRKKYIPRRINEGWGLQHMKLYGVDDSILLSGANLSTDYFTNRQDRYHVFASAELADAYWKLQRGVASLSFRIEPVDTATKEEGFNMVWPASNAAPSPLEAPKEFVTRATGVLKGLMQPTAANTASPLLTDGKELAEKTKTPDTSVYVLAQMTQLLMPDSSTERPALTHVLKTLSAPQYATASSWTFTAGYFNPAPSLTKLLLATSAQANNTVITAAPQANGFYGSSGVSSMLPDAYTFLAHRFLRAVRAQHRDDAITLKEWRKGTVGEPEGWTYHAKGLWVTLRPQDTKSDSSESAALSVIGSSNYTKRSYSLDLEANALIVTRSVELQKRLSEEQAWLQTHASAVTRDDFAKPERRVRLHVRIAMWIVQAVGGQL